MEPFLDLSLIMALGFLGSFGHCVGMCGPLAVALALPATPGVTGWGRSLVFHGLLNLGRLISYTLVGAGIGTIGSVLVAGGQLAGIDSALRQGLAMGTGGLLIWLGLGQVAPALLPKVPLLRGKRPPPWLTALLTQNAFLSHPLAPLLLGAVWGLMPCGFLYVAQVKAAATSSPWQGAATLLAFGLGTLPSMVGVGLFAARLSADRRSQLFRMGGWVTLIIGILTLFRTSAMVDYTGQAALALLMLALVARPLRSILPGLLKYRRGIGVGAFGLAIAHTAHMLDHTFGWRLGAIPFLLPGQQLGIWAGIATLGLLTPAAMTSFDGLVQKRWWRWVHGLVIPAFGLAVVHTILAGSRYMGSFEWTLTHQLQTLTLLLFTLGVFLLRGYCSANVNPRE